MFGSQSIVVGLPTRHRALHHGWSGDGEQTVTELIDLENQRRAETADEGFFQETKRSSAARWTLQKQNLRAKRFVSAGQVVTLRSVANVRRWGYRNPRY